MPPEPEDSARLGDAGYAMYASAFAWVPCVFCAAAYIAGSFHRTGKVSFADTLMWVLLVGGAVFLLVALIAVARSKRPTRWIFVPLTCVPIVIAVFWLLLAASYSGGIYK